MLWMLELFSYVGTYVFEFADWLSKPRINRIKKSKKPKWLFLYLCLSNYFMIFEEQFLLGFWPHKGACSVIFYKINSLKQNQPIVITDRLWCKGYQSDRKKTDKYKNSIIESKNFNGDDDHFCFYDLFILCQKSIFTSKAQHCQHPVLDPFCFLCSFDLKYFPLFQ